MTDLALFGWGVVAWAAIIILPVWAVASVQCWIYARRRRRDYDEN